MDAIDFVGHIRSCGPTLNGVPAKCDSSKLMFDANGDGFGVMLKVPDTAMDSGQSFAITLPQENGEVLTTASKKSSLQEVGALSAGSIVSGFGSAEFSGLTVRGASNLYGHVTIGASLADKLDINSHIVSNTLVFDANSDSVRYILRFPDPSTTDMQARHPPLVSWCLGCVERPRRPRVQGPRFGSAQARAARVSNPRMPICCDSFWRLFGRRSASWISRWRPARCSRARARTPRCRRWARCTRAAS